MGVYKRGAVWYYCILKGGRRIRKATKAETKRAAEVEAALASGGPPPSEGDAGISLKDAIMRVYNEEWQHHKSGLKMVNRTLKIVGILGDIPLKQVDESAIAKMVAYLEQENLSQSSVNRYRAYLRRVLNLAYKKWSLIDRVPYIRNTKEVQKRFKVYSAQEEDLIINYNGREFADLAILLFDTGMRLGEALGLHWVEVGADTITIWADATKGGKSRGIPMTQRVREMLSRRRMPLAFDRVFGFRDQHEVERIWSRFKRVQGIVEEGWVIHAMRHTFASRLVQRGVDLYTVGTLLGHSTIKVTERYAHLNPSRLAQAMRVLEEGGDRVAAELHS